MHSVGDTVFSNCRIYDYEPDGRAVCIARPGERGCIEYIGPDGIPFVRWVDSGRAADCSPTEIESEVGHAL
jgi:hypothetical protein